MNQHSTQRGLLFILVFVLGILLGVSISIVRSRLSSQDTQTTIRQAESIDYEEKAGSLVTGFPPVPLYPRATVKSSFRHIQRDKTSYHATMITSDDIGSVAQWYDEALRRDTAFTITATPEDPESGELVYEMELSGGKVILIIEKENEAITEITLDFLK